MELMITGNISP